MECINTSVPALVLVSLLRFCCAYDNIALGKKATHEPVLTSEYGPEKAVDGNINNRITGNSCAITNPGNNDQTTAVWQVDLGEIKSINSVKIYYRNDSSQDYRTRFAGFSLYISNTNHKEDGHLCYHNTGPLPPLVFSQKCTVHGRFVIIYNERKPGTTYPSSYSDVAILELCEVMVFGCNRKYGSKCDQLCPDGCQNDNCDVTDGTCISCKDGLTGSKCTQECPTGFYGTKCRYACSQYCATSGHCHHVTGHCPDGCKEGWTGDKCQIVCQNGKYGRNCEDSCGHCRGGYPCDKSTGRCVECASGYMLPDCHDKCVSGKYGFNCTKECGYCENDRVCNHVTGYCTLGCADGWRNLKCDTECPTSYYGRNCSKSCSSHCKGGRLCNHVTGYCTSGCADGWRNSKCDKECTTSYYGKNCSKSCSSHCKGGRLCNHVTGSCDQGCLSGFYGFTCESSYPIQDNSTHERTTQCYECDSSTFSVAAVIAVVEGLLIGLGGVTFFVYFFRRGKQQFTRRTPRDTTNDTEMQNCNTRDISNNVSNLGGEINYMQIDDMKRNSHEYETANMNLSPSTFRS